MTVRKLGRNYRMVIHDNKGPIKDITIEPPFTTEFNIVRSTLASASSATFRVYNLSEAKRNAIQKDNIEVNIIKRIEVYGGYGDDLYLIFAGNIYHAYSERQGTNNITTMSCLDGGFAMVKAELSGKTKSGQIKHLKLVSEMIATLGEFDVTKGAIGSLKGTTKRGYSFDGKSIDKIRELASNSGSKTFIDNKKLNILNDYEYIDGKTPLINSKTGLLGTPKVGTGKIDFRMIFEPSLYIAQKIRIESDTQKKLLNGGEYKIVSISHSGIFSDSVSGTAVTEVGCFFGAKGFQAVRV